MAIFVTATAFKRELAKYVRTLVRTGRSLDIGIGRKRRYRVDPADPALRDVRAVPIGIEEARQNFFTIRCLLETEPGIVFALVVDGQVAAMLRRHDLHDAPLVQRYRDAWRLRCELAEKLKSVPNIAERASIETLIGRLAAPRQRVRVRKATTPARKRVLKAEKGERRSNE